MNKIPSSSCVRFEVQEVTTTPVKEELKKVARFWGVLAVQESFKPCYQPWEKERFIAVSTIAGDIPRKIDYTIGNSDSVFRVFACYDSQKSLESILVTKDKSSSLFVSSMLSHPCKTANNKGAGTALMYHLFEKCIQEGKKSIGVFPLGSSVGFYTKVGFTVPKPTDEEMCPLHITAAKIQVLMVKKN